MFKHKFKSWWSHSHPCLGIQDSRTVCVLRVVGIYLLFTASVSSCMRKRVDSTLFEVFSCSVMFVLDGQKYLDTLSVTPIFACCKVFCKSFSMQLILQFISYVFSGVEVRLLCRPLKFIHTKLGIPCVNKLCFVPRGRNRCRPLITRDRDILILQHTKTFCKILCSQICGNSLGKNMHVKVRCLHVVW